MLLEKFQLWLNYLFGIYDLLHVVHTDFVSESVFSHYYYKPAKATKISIKKAKSMMMKEVQSKATQRWKAPIQVYNKLKNKYKNVS